MKFQVLGYAVPREVQYRANTGLVLERIRPKILVPPQKARLRL